MGYPEPATTLWRRGGWRPEDLPGLGNSRMTVDYRRLSPLFIVLVRKLGIGLQYQRLRDSAPRLAMRAATQPAQINYHREQQPQEIDSRRRHATVKFPCVYDRGERQENEADYRHHQTTVECAL